MSYFIILKTDWVFNAREFSRQLLMRWPAARMKEVRPTTKYSDLLEFEFAMEESTLYGSLNWECNAVIFHARLQDSATFTQWCRLLIPLSEMVIFCDETMSINFVLEPGMTPVEIVQAMSAPEY
ncbi:hypothetical protein [Archangium sp.]|uniref:hypothetical protein n=1 Tax=Archangium sp. TaxID=1872627 RepID=UPI00389A9118